VETMSFTWLTAVAALLTAVAAWLIGATGIAVNVTNARAERRSNSANMLVDFIRRFESKEFVGFRAELAKKFQRGAITEFENDDWEVANFFHTIGSWTHLKILDPQLVYKEFCHDAVRWWSLIAKTGQIQKFRSETKDATYYREFEWLHGEMIRIDAKERKLRLHDVIPSELDLRDYVDGEAALQG
jgi:hypothetical protein